MSHAETSPTCFPFRCPPLRPALPAALLAALLSSACAPVQDEPPPAPPPLTHSLDYAESLGLRPPDPEERAAFPRCDHFLDVRWLRRLARRPHRQVDPDRQDRVKGYWVGKVTVRVLDLNKNATGEERELVVLEHRARSGRFTVFDMSADGVKVRGEALDQLLLTADKIRSSYWLHKTDDYTRPGLRITTNRRHTVLKEGITGEQAQYQEGLVAPDLGLVSPVPDGKRVCIGAPKVPRADRQERREQRKQDQFLHNFE